MAPAARDQAMIDLTVADGDTITKDVRAALVKAMKSPSCLVVANAARLFEIHDDRRYVPNVANAVCPRNAVSIW